MFKNLKNKIIENRIKYLIFFPVLILHLSCRHDQDIIMTVKGPINPAEMGVTLSHEHVMVDWIGADSTGPQRWDRGTVIRTVLPYLKDLRILGCATFIDCTPPFLGRDVHILKALSDSSGMHILTATGYYGAHQDKFIPSKAKTETAGEIAGHWISEWEEGIENTGIKPGIIKIGVNDTDTLPEMHQKLVRAAAIAHLATGLTIVSHTGPGRSILQQVKILKEEGVAPSALVWAHAQRGTQELQLEAARKGVWISLDNVNDNPETIAEYVGMIRTMKENNLLHKVLLSHDAGWYDVKGLLGNKFRPYTTIFASLVPALKQEGFTEQDIHQLLIVNPKDAFTVRKRSNTTIRNN